MFSDERSELSIPVVGFLLLGFATIFAGISILNMKWDFLDQLATGTATLTIFAAFGALLGVISFFAFAKAYLIEGATFGIFAVFMFAMGIGQFTFYEMSLLGIVLAIAAILVVFMSYRAGDLLVLLLGIFTIVAMLPLFLLDGDVVATTNSAVVVVIAIGFIAVGAIALIQTLFEWMLVQDIAADFAEYMYGDDAEECGCGCGSAEED